MNETHIQLLAFKLCFKFGKWFSESIVYSFTIKNNEVTEATAYSFFSIRLLVGSAWSFRFFIPATTANDLQHRRISIPDLIHYIIPLQTTAKTSDMSDCFAI